MKAGEARVGHHVRFLVPMTAYSDVFAGDVGVIRGILAQNRGARDDAVYVHPAKWKDNLILPCETSNLMLLKEKL